MTTYTVSSCQADYDDNDADDDNKITKEPNVAV